MYCSKLFTQSTDDCIPTDSIVAGTSGQLIPPIYDNSIRNTLFRLVLNLNRLSRPGSA